MLSRTFRVARQQTRLLSSSRFLAHKAPANVKTAQTLSEVTGPDGSLIGPGAKPGTIPTDLDQATGLERLEILAKREGVDVFDLENPITEGSGTIEDPYLVPTYLGFRYVGCKGKDGEDHKPYWMKVEEGKLARCWQCGTVLKTKYLGEPGHAHH
ncbi:cytochrome c oxidase polypeptide IV mitochondrial precursor [Scheffersomyces xylosifermentans]|uniref:cytochrome c oxidase polypeptide IV mitochondrial precursor n=1 Tax=Scheffersomyces xylosifermentans TaxID=1304137 RepID=UPI00315D6C7F